MQSAIWTLARRAGLRRAGLRRPRPRHPALDDFVSGMSLGHVFRGGFWGQQL